MKALILPEHYYRNDVLEKEHELLFQQTWCFIGFKSFLKEENDFITQDIGGIPIVVQNCRGTIKAFKNICSHRHSIIQVEQSGNRPLMCPYHGWAYNDKGVPTGIPKKPLFKFTKDELECLKLKEYKVDFCGELIFVNLSNDPSELKDFMGDLFEEVEKMTNNFGELVDVNDMVINANWKILVENTLESYHVNLIHEETFKKLGAGGMEFTFIKEHSVWDATLLAGENEGKNAKIHSPYQNREYKISGYKHLVVFPNVLISSTYGISFNLSYITPIDSNSSKFVSYVFLTKKEGEKANPTLENIYKQSLVSFNRKVFDEDKTICEKVQIGVKKSPFTGELSDEEARVCEFQKNYKKYID
ncbi:aromatic ring-hydroxylating oxygenase subunit alpha [Chryseobacterium aureum]|uniref:aromatic ring-hydroxylating oxygenase subunit alpha n=1 Tax=Chryseobacterium aureum TaxID=2497456 RepID=UPI000F8769D4|nr:aromatic ring-hydroxylating dioxygenase subunit alpha [Chryseobacterium aureum]